MKMQTSNMAAQLLHTLDARQRKQNTNRLHGVCVCQQRYSGADRTASTTTAESPYHTKTSKF